MMTTNVREPLDTGAPPTIVDSHDPMEVLARIHQQNTRDIHESAQHSQMRLLLTFLATLLLAGMFHAYSLRPAAPPVAIRNLHAMSPTELCPGDSLTYNYDLVGNEPVVINITTTMWRVTPPQTVVHSGSKPDILVPPIRHVTGESFVIPAFVFDPMVPELVEITAGNYTRRVAVTALGRDTEAEIAELPFTVMEDCE